MKPLAVLGRPVTEASVISYLQMEVRRAGTIKALADEYGMSQFYLGDVLHGTRHPSGKLLKVLGLRRVVMYELAPADTTKGEPTP